MNMKVDPSLAESSDETTASANTLISHFLETLRQNVQSIHAQISENQKLWDNKSV